jgi:hypothetical protein
MNKQNSYLILSGIDKSIQFKGMKHNDIRTESDKLLRKQPQYLMTNKATGKPIEIVG